MIDFSEKMTREKLEDFADSLRAMSRKTYGKVSSRGWCYLLEQARFINKDDFDRAEKLINRCRKEGYLPVDFVAEEDARAFVGVEQKSTYTLKSLLRQNLEDVLEGHRFYTPDWWDGEEFYVQMLVEKIDLKTLFEDVCREYHVPIANSKGWSSISQRAEYAKRFKDAELRGLTPVLLYCGDHDPDGLRISDTIRANLEQIQHVRWSDGGDGYDPSNLIIHRFGLNYDFIEANGYTWIDNLITGSGMNLASPSHRNFSFDYVQNYLRNFGERKCEANAVVTTPREAQALCRGELEKILGLDAIARFKEKKKIVEKKYISLLERFDLNDKIEDILAEHDDDDTEEEDDE